MPSPNLRDLPAPPNGDLLPPARPAEKRREYAAGGATAAPEQPAQTIAWQLTEENAYFGDATWDRMRRDAGIAAAIKTLLAGVLAKPLTIGPAREPEAGQEVEGSEAADYELSATVARYMTWAAENLGRPLKRWLWEAFEGGLIYGSKLAEKVYTVEPRANGGEWAGFLRYERLPFKPRKNWRFRVDPVGNVAGVEVFTGEGEWVALPREKFAILALGERDGDPRGESALVPCWKPWNLRAQLWPDWHVFTKRHAEPALVVEGPPEDLYASAGGSASASEEDLELLIRRQLDTRIAQATAGTSVAQLEENVKRFRNGSYLILPNGAKAYYLHNEGGADVFLEVFRSTLEQIIQVLLLTTTATLDTQHNSRAQSRTGQDVLGTFLLSARETLCLWLEWDLFYPLCLYNFGTATAARHTPRASLGAVEAREVVELMGALAQLGYSIAGSQTPAIDAMLGLPVRRPDEIPDPQAAQQSASDRLSDPPGVSGDPIGTEADEPAGGPSAKAPRRGRKAPAAGQIPLFS